MRGCSEDFAVLCSETRTYEMKLRESSNTMLLCSNILCPDNTDPDPSRQTADLQVGAILAYSDTVAICFNTRVL